MAQAPNADPSRVFGGIAQLEGGMDGGRDASLIDLNQAAASVNFTFRDSYAQTRPPLTNLPLHYESAVCKQRANLRFQGALFYEAESGSSGFIYSVSGRLFRIQLGLTNEVTEITPKLVVVTTLNFTVPAPTFTVVVAVTSESPFTVGQTLYIDSGQYTVSSKAANQLTLVYVGGAANPVVLAGTAILDSSHAQIIQYYTNDPNVNLIDIRQAENYALVFGGQHSTVIYDGSTARLAGPGELPPGLFGLYAWGRVWVALNDRRTFIAGDLIYGPSGTVGLSFRDSILKVTENDFLNEGGTFNVPNNAGPMTSMFTLATQDTSLGIGPILVGTTNSVISVNAPVDRTTWKNLQYPIQTISLIDYGPTGPRAGTGVNGDQWYRALDAIRSFIVARRDINVWGNTPVSHEVSPILDGDSTDLLYYASAVLFDNKLFTTVSPYYTDHGVAHRGLAVINFDEVSSLRGKTMPAWEGAVTGAQVLQVLKGRIDGIERGFMFVLCDGRIELWEILKEGDYDMYRATNQGSPLMIRSSIDTVLISRRDNFGDGSQLHQLYTAELFVDDLVDDVTLRIYFRPDEYPTWILWTQLDFCSPVTQCVPPVGCAVFQEDRKQYGARVMLSQPSEDPCNPFTGMPINLGYEFQFKIEGTGHYRLRKFRAHALLKKDKMVGECASPPTCAPFPACDLNWFDYEIDQGGASAEVYFNCDPGTIMTFIGVLPDWITLDTVNNRLVGAAGSFIAIDSATATIMAQSALNLFGTQQISLETLFCGIPS